MKKYYTMHDCFNECGDDDIPYINDCCSGWNHIMKHSLKQLTYKKRFLPSPKQMSSNKWQIKRAEPKVLGAEEWLTTSWETQKSIKNFGGYNDMVCTYEAGDKNGQLREYYRPEQVELRKTCERLKQTDGCWDDERQVYISAILTALKNLEPPTIN